jgi:chemotaxis response regulator CheB
MVRTLRPELVTLDLVMPVRGGLESLPYLLSVDPSLAVVVHSASSGDYRVTGMR